MIRFEHAIQDIVEHRLVHLPEFGRAERSASIQ